jgi:hypothetical protein
MRGEFLRGHDAGRGVDSGRVFGTFQGDELRSHKHDLSRLASYHDDGGGGYSLRTEGSETEETGFFGGNETRPRNVAMLFCVKF